MPFFRDSDVDSSPIKEVHSELWSIATDINSFIERFYRGISVSNNDVDKLIAVTLYLRCHADYQAIILMASRGMLAQSYVIVRTLVETVFIISAIEKDSGFANKFVGHEEHQRKGVLGKLRRYKESVDANHSDLPKIEKLIKSIVDKISTNTIGKLSTEEISKIGGLHNWYDTVYAYTSMYVHISPRTLEQYIDSDSGTKKIKSLSFGPQFEELNRPVSTAVGAICKSIESLCGILGIPIEAEFQKLDSRYVAYHKKIQW